MRTILILLLALLAGYGSGLLLSEVIGITGYLLFRQAIGIKYLPIFLALACGAVALAIDLAARRKSR